MYYILFTAMLIQIISVYFIPCCTLQLYQICVSQSKSIMKNISIFINLSEKEKKIIRECFLPIMNILARIKKNARLLLQPPTRKLAYQFIIRTTHLCFCAITKNISNRQHAVVFDRDRLVSKLGSSVGLYLSHHFFLKITIYVCMYSTTSEY